MHGASSTQAVVAQAAEWAALLDDLPVSSETRRAFEDWCGQDAQNRPTFERMRHLGDRFGRLDQAEALTITRVAALSPRSRRVAGGIACILAVMGAGAVMSRNYDLQSLWPEYALAAGEQRQIALADGSQLVADTGTRFNAYTTVSESRRIRLFEGRIMAKVARRPGAEFVVETKEGTATALGTVYSVHRDNQRTILTVLESRVRLCTKSDLCRTLGAGERAEMTGTTIARLAPVDPQAAGLWATGWIEVDDRPLPELIDELARYRTAPVRYDARDLAGTRVTGSYPLAEPDAAFRSIAQATGLNLSIGSDGTMELSLAGK